jgi:serine/threonine-protein kinase
VVYVGSDDSNVYALNAATGAKVWNYTTGSVVISSPAVVNGVVYVGSHDGNVYALNAATGVRLWNYTTGNAVYSSPAVVNGVVYVGSEDGNVYAFSLAGGLTAGVLQLRRAHKVDLASLRPNLSLKIRR